MAVFGATAVVALVALSRMVLGVRYLSDVLAAFAEGAAWLTVCIVGIRTYCSTVPALSVAGKLPATTGASK